MELETLAICIFEFTAKLPLEVTKSIEESPIAA